MITTKKIGEGPNHLVLHVFMQSDGAELDNYVLLAPSDLNPALPVKPALRIMRVWYGFSWFDVTLKFGGITPRPVWTLPRDIQEFDFTIFGGIKDVTTSPPSDQDGKILISTNDFAPAGSQGSLVIEFRKP